MNSGTATVDDGDMIRDAFGNLVVRPVGATLRFTTGGIIGTHRKDVVTCGGDPDRILANAPETSEGFFVVPKAVGR